MKQLRDSVFAGILSVKIGYAMNPVSVVIGAGITLAFGLSILHIFGI